MGEAISMRALVRWGVLGVVSVMLAGCTTIWEGTAAGYAREQGFTFAAPRGEAVAESWLTQPIRVSKVEDACGRGVAVDYARFALREYGASGELSAERLEACLDVGWWPDKGLRGMASVERTTISGRPAVVARVPGSGAIVFQPAAGVVVRLEPWGEVPMGIDEARAVAEAWGR